MFYLVLFVCYHHAIEMDRLNPSVSYSYWKVAATILLFVVVTSTMSSRCFETHKLPRKHVLKLLDMLRLSGEHSIRASQNTQPVTIFSDTCMAKHTIDTVAQFLTNDQVKDLAGVDLLEMREFISQQHKNATEVLLKAYIEKKRFTPVA